MVADADARRAEILDAAGAVFIEKGFEAATTLEIARRARVSKRDLYKLFASKQGMLEELIATSSASLTIPPALGLPEDLAGFLASLRSFGAGFLGELLVPRRVALYRLAIAEAPRSNKMGMALQESGAALVRASAQAFVRHAVQRGIVRQADAELVMLTFFDVLIGPWQVRLLLGTHATPDAAEIAARADRAVEVVRRLLA